ncbi:hypothetical protein QQ045_028477 [Rhodiola kirilowii]
MYSCSLISSLNKKERTTNKLRRTNNQQAQIKRKKKNRKSGLQLRGTPSVLKDVIDGLSDEQKTVVASMGLAPILQMKFKKIPTCLALQVLQSFNPDTLTVTTKSRDLHINELDVHCVFGFDLDGQDIYIRKRKKKGSIFKKWKESYGFGDKKQYPNNTDIAARLKMMNGVD